MNIGEKIRSIREEKGLTQVQLAQKSGLTQATICRIERSSGERKSNRAREIGGETLRRLAQVLEVPVDYLVGRVRSRTPEATVAMDKTAQRLVETYSTVGRTEKDVLANLADYFRAQQTQQISFRPTAPLPREGKQADGELEKEEIFYRVVDVKRKTVDRAGSSHIEYGVKLSMVRLRAGTKIEVKKIGDQFVVSVPKGEEVKNTVKAVKIDGSYSLPECFNLNEPMILAGAIDRAKEAGEKLLRE